MCPTHGYYLFPLVTLCLVEQKNPTLNTCVHTENFHLAHKCFHFMAENKNQYQTPHVAFVGRLPLVSTASLVWEMDPGPVEPHNLPLDETSANSDKDKGSATKPVLGAACRFHAHLQRRAYAILHKSFSDAPHAQTFSLEQNIQNRLFRSLNVCLSLDSMYSSCRSQPS